MMNHERTPIFYSRTGKRWKRIKFFTFLLVLFLVFLFSAFAVTLLVDPKLKYAQYTPPIHLTYVKPDSTKKLLTNSFGDVENNVDPTRPASAQHMAFLLNSPVSIASLKANIDKIDVVMAGWLHLNSAAGDIIEDDPKMQNDVLNYLSTSKSKIKVLAVVDNIWKSNQKDNLFNPTTLSNPAIRQKITTQLLNYVQAHHLAGINIDFENVTPESRADLVQFMAELSSAFHSKNLLATIDVPADDDAFDYKKLAAYVDFEILMAYDENWATSAPGPIASLQWFRDILSARAPEIPPAKLVIGIANYAYDWQDQSLTAEQKHFADVMLLARQAGAQITLDTASLNPTFKYRDNKENLHEVWFLDAVTAFNQLAMSKYLHPHGYALFLLGAEDDSFWKIFNNNELDQAAADSLKTITLRYATSKQGAGYALTVQDIQENGVREISFDKQLGIIMGEKYLTPAVSQAIYQSGTARSNLLALTFDDGPNPPYTTQILDLLKATHTPATFFVIGNNALKYPALLKREIAEGHNLGNHTFTHPDITKITNRQLRLELSTTERLLQATIGKGSILFRPPYGIDSTPETPNEVLPLVTATKLGYISIATDIDSMDWKQPGVGKIVQNVLNQINANQGNIITFHDGGGTSRSQTVAALTILIPMLKSAGYQFVTVGELLNKSPEELMPAANNSFVALIDKACFKILDNTLYILKCLLLFSIIAGILRLIFVSALAIYQKANEKEFIAHPRDFSVTAIIPAYNEEKVILATVTSLLQSELPEKFELIVVNDGSTDKTLEILNRHFQNNPAVKILDQKNQGKAAALNYAISLSKNDIIVTLDADTLYTKSTIMHLISVFHDPKVGAVAGTVRVGNQINVMTRWQALEYTTNQNLDRRAFKTLNAIPVVPGAVGAWRRTAVLAAGGFTNDTLTEDFDLTFKIRKLGYRIVFSQYGAGATEAPDTIYGFLRQRYRWMYGTLQVMWKHKDALFNSRYTTLGFIAIPNIILQIIIQLIAPIMDIAFIASLIGLGLDWWFHPHADFNINLVLILIYYIGFMIVDMLAAVIAFAIDGKEKKTLLFWLIPQRFVYRQLIYYIVFKTLRAALRGREVWWGRSQRKATVKI